MNYRPTALPPVSITALAAGGAGVGRLPDGMTVFVPRTAPGDTVHLDAVKRHKRHAQASVANVVTPGPGRQDPPCAHFTRERCGGCQWQHLAADAQHAAKARIVGDALRRIGGCDVADPPLVPSPRALGYRATLTLTVRRSAGRVVAGFHQEDDPGRVFALDRCLIARPELQSLWGAVRPALEALPRGDDVRLKLRVADDGGLHVVVSGGEDAWGGASRVAAAAAAGGSPAIVWWQPAGGAVRRMAGGEERGDPERDAGAVGFAQVNPEVAGMVREAVVAAADRRTGGRADRVIDLYAGAGDTAVPLAAAGCEVVMVDSDERAVERASQRAKRNGLTMRCIAARAEDVVAKLLPAEVVIVNPPRTGLVAAVTDRLSASPPVRLIYVSCDPATLARDLKRMGLRAEHLVSVTAFDMFPQTSHVETLVVAEPVRPAAGPPVRLP